MKFNPSFVEIKEKIDSANHIDQIEDIFWESITKIRKMYSFVNEFSLFGEDVVLWNLGKFTNEHSNIHATPSDASVSI